MSYQSKRMNSIFTLNIIIVLVNIHSAQGRICYVCGRGSEEPFAYNSKTKLEYPIDIPLSCDEFELSINLDKFIFTCPTNYVGCITQTDCEQMYCVLELVLPIYDASEEWKRQWNSSNVTNHSLVTDPTKKLAGFDLDRKTWKTINRIRTGHGRTGQMLSRWNNTSPECDCGANSQTMEHIVNVCPLRRFCGGITELHELTPEAVDWLRNIDIEL